LKTSSRHSFQNDIFDFFCQINVVYEIQLNGKTENEDNVHLDTSNRREQSIHDNNDLILKNNYKNNVTMFILNRQKLNQSLKKAPDCLMYCVTVHY